MRLTLILTLVLLTGFWATNFALYFAKMNLHPQSVKDYYLGSESNYTLPKTYQSMLEVTHAHLAMIALVTLLLTHLLIFAAYSFRAKVFFIAAGFSFALLNESAGWLVRFVHPEFAWLKVISFACFEIVLGILLFSLGHFLFMRSPKNESKAGAKNGHHSEASRNPAPTLQSNEA